MDAEEVRRRINEARVGRLATVRKDGTPHLVPVCFALIGHRLVSAVDDKPKSTPRLKRLENIGAHPAVTLLVDHYGEEWSTVWWARADGVARVVEDGPEHEEAVSALRAKYEQYQAIGVSGAAIVIDVTRWTGWAYSA